MDKSLQQYNPHKVRITIIPENSTDSNVIDLWLHGRPETTKNAYQADIEMFLQFTQGKSFHDINLKDLQDYVDSLEGEQTSIARRISALKSLFSFCYWTGYLPINKCAMIKPPKLETKLAERILSESQIQKIIALETDQRNHLILRLFYNAGMRCSELVKLRWIDIKPNKNGGQVRISGKGTKERYVVISPETYQKLLEMREDALDTNFVFQSHKYKGQPLDRSQVNRIVKKAAIRAGVEAYEEEVDIKGKQAKRKNSRVSPHWLRHAHASHALDRGATLPLVRDTLGHSSIAVTNKYSHAKPDESSGMYLPI